MRRVRRREQVARLEAELEQARPYLALAREISAEVSHLADTDGADALVEALERIPRRERETIARALFAKLPTERQWEILERVFEDEELRGALETARRKLIDRQRAQATGQLDMGAIPEGERITLGLFRERDALDAIDLGHRSSVCARRLVLVAETDGRFRVIEDVFNPEHGYFVTGDYDHLVWETSDRLAAHTIVRPGTITGENSHGSFEPVLHIGARADFERDGLLVEGRLHLGYVMVGDVDVFAKRGTGQ